MFSIGVIRHYDARVRENHVGSHRHLDIYRVATISATGALLHVGTVESAIEAGTATLAIDQRTTYHAIARCATIDLIAHFQQISYIGVIVFRPLKRFTQQLGKRCTFHFRRRLGCTIARHGVQRLVVVKGAGIATIRAAIGTLIGLDVGTETVVGTSAVDPTYDTSCVAATDGTAATITMIKRTTCIDMAHDRTAEAIVAFSNDVSFSITAVDLSITSDATSYGSCIT